MVRKYTAVILVTRVKEESLDNISQTSSESMTVQQMLEYLVKKDKEQRSRMVEILEAMVPVLEERFPFPDVQEYCQDVMKCGNALDQGDHTCGKINCMVWHYHNWRIWKLGLR